MRNMRVQLLVAVVLCSWLLAEVWAADKPFTLEQVLSSPFPSDMTAATMRPRIVWAFDAQGKRNVWVAEGPQFKARQLTNYNDDEGQEITDVTLCPDGDHVVFVRGGGKNSAGEYPNPTSDVRGAEQAVWAVRWSGGKPIRLGEGYSPVISPAGQQVAFIKDNQIWSAPLSNIGSARILAIGSAKQLFIARGNNGSPVWSPDGKSLAFVSDRGDHSWIGVYTPSNSSIQYVAPTVDRDTTPRWSPDGKRIAYVRQAGAGGEPLPEGSEPRGNPWAIWVADVKSGTAREVWRSGSKPESSPPRRIGAGLLEWGASGTLLFASEEDGWLHLYALPEGARQARLLTPGACEVEHVAMTPDRKWVVYSSNCGDIDRRHLWKVSVEGGDPIRLLAGDGMEWNPAITGDGQWIAHIRSEAAQPAMPYIMNMKGEDSMMLAQEALPKDFPVTQLVIPQQVIFKAADGWDIHGQLFLPPGGDSNTRKPAVVFMHGGPQRQMLLGWHYLYYYHNTYGMNQYLASRGYVVVSVNYRSGIGYGFGFREAKDRGARGASEYQDIVAAALYLRTRPDVDLTKIGLYGGSYGGYLTALGLARNSDLFAAGVDIHGVHDWSARLRGGGGFSSQPTSAETVRRARESSPVASVATWRSPVLLVHGDDDRNVAFSQTVDLVQRLRAHKVLFEQKVYPDEIHDFLLHAHWVEIYKAAAEFFDRQLKGIKAETANPE